MTTMRDTPSWPQCIGLVAVTVVAVMFTAHVNAQRRRGNDNSSFGAPVATNTIVDAPETYLGKLVTVTAGIERMTSKTSFVMDQQRVSGANEVKTIGKPLLVIAPYLTTSLEQKKYFLVRGQVVTLAPGALSRIAPDYVLDLPDEVSAKYMGKPVLVASSVLNSTYAELGRKPIPPPTPADVALTTAMKTISPAFTALRAAAQDANTDVVKANVAALVPAFAKTESVLAELRHAGAARAREAAAQVASIDNALSAGKWDEVTSSANALNQTCQNCHTAYRERQDDGTYRIKE